MAGSRRSARSTTPTSTPSVTSSTDDLYQRSTGSHHQRHSTRPLRSPPETAADLAPDVLCSPSLGAIAFISIGIALGTALPSARSAQGLGMVLFFPFFLLGGAGPPPDAMGDLMSSIANAVPLTTSCAPSRNRGSTSATHRHVAVLAGLAALGHRRVAHAQHPDRRMIRPDGPLALHAPPKARVGMTVMMNTARYRTNAAAIQDRADRPWARRCNAAAKPVITKAPMNVAGTRGW
jgi:hypothetical protein